MGYFEDSKLTQSTTGNKKISLNGSKNVNALY
jgi:hypothetical protein